jgi:hypothetical protein
MLMLFRYDCEVNKLIGSPPGYRRRSPFVPFAIRNDTASRIWFTTLITSPDRWELLCNCRRLFVLPITVYNLGFMLDSVNYKVNIIKCCSISDPLQGRDSSLEQDEVWTSVGPGDTVPFSFEGRGESVYAHTSKYAWCCSGIMHAYKKQEFIITPACVGTHKYIIFISKTRFEMCRNQNFVRKMQVNPWTEQPYNMFSFTLVSR